MSTKIYNGYRVKKTTPLMPLLHRLTEVSTNWIAGNKDALYLIHTCALIEAKDDVARSIKLGETPNYHAQELLAENAKENGGKQSLWLDCWIFKVMQLAELDPKIGNPLSVKFECSVAFDDEYWYLKFFPNNFANRMMEAIEKECTELEDYHYQNSTDMPDGVTEADWEAREKKWEALIAPSRNFSGLLHYCVFDADKFRDLMGRYYFTGEKDLYKHLAYKFERVEFKEESKQSSTLSTP